MLHELTLSGLTAKLAAKEVSSREAMQACLDRIDAVDGQVNAFMSIDRDDALGQADAADATLAKEDTHAAQQLLGVPISLKDLFCAKGQPANCSSKILGDFRSPYDGTVVRKLRDAGAVLIAKLATGEFAQGDRWYRGRTKNPWNIEEGSSGSSAGPGSATAAACVAFGIGTETRGSIVSPSRRNGLSALRPTFGRITRYGAMVLSWSMDKPGPMCRSIEDCALVFNAIHGASEKDPATITAPFVYDRRVDLSTLRIGFDEDAPESFLEKLSELGANLREMNELPNARMDQLGAESAAAFDYHIAPGGVEPEPLPEDLEPADRRRRGRFRRGRDMRALDYINGQRRRLILMQEMAEAMDGFDMFVSGSGAVGLTNDTGHPAVIVPYGFGVRNPDADSPTTMPLTTTIVGDLFADDKILNVAQAFQSTTDWHVRRPAMDF